MILEFSEFCHADSFNQDERPLGPPIPPYFLYTFGKEKGVISKAI
jgi:hypothetical protein